ncbi:hypothetical protein [Rheinheimera faecalis]|uniref:hypothetical protein n=1 Tax=Rheinheimera faecalis TaxID=2901141 RepID=UPI001E377E04|nr:hypothetical protein [Rheinheimera faecalis]
MRIGVLLGFDDLKRLIDRKVDILVIMPGSNFDEFDIKSLSNLPCVDLNDYLVKGEISSLSRRVATFIRSFVSAIIAPNEALSSQNDLYQYHLRSQYLFLTALERYLDTVKNYTLVFQVKRYRRYYSPMRPDVGMFYNPKRTLAFVASQLAEKNGEDSEFLPDLVSPLVQRFTDYLVLSFRKNLTDFFIFWKLLGKVSSSIIEKYSRGQSIDSDCFNDNTKIGIIVRTDSEVISASYLIDYYKSIGKDCVVIQDEMLSSKTTVSRLNSLGLKYVSIGSMTGVKGLFFSLFSRSKLVYSSPKSSSSFVANSKAENVLFEDRFVVRELKNRLLDFFLPQHHFATELSSMVKHFKINKLVTFAYVDQWGGIVKAVGDLHRIKTFAVQNAAQDPEEYPRLCWADHYCVESLYLKKRLVSLGYPEEKITGTGLPHYSVGAVDKEININISQINQIVILTQPIYERYYNVLIEAVSTFCGRYGYTLAVKYHPRQVGNEYDRAINAASKKCTVKVFKSEPLDQIVLSSKLAISIVSAAILRCLNLGVPTVSFLPKSEKYLDLYYTDISNVFVVSDVDALNQLMNEIERDYGSFLNEFKTKLEHYFSEHCVFEPTQNPLLNVAEVIHSENDI